MGASDASDAEGPGWLGRVVYGGLLAALVGVGLLALGLAGGWADPPGAGPLLWETDFKAGDGGWTFTAPALGRLAPAEGALLAVYAGAATDVMAVGLAPEAAGGDFTLEVAGAAAAGNPAYGLVFGWQDSGHYSALLINGNGYAEAYRQTGDERVPWFGWQQWPHILVGTENNRLRVDVRGDDLTLRVNDEIVVVAASPATGGRVGVMVRFDAEMGSKDRVVFSWARVWGR